MLTILLCCVFCLSLWFYITSRLPSSFPPGPRFPLPFIGDTIYLGSNIVTGLKKLKNEFGDRLTFHGAIDTQDLLPYGSAEEITDEVKRIIGIFGKGGGYIAAPVHNIQSDVPVENIIALSDAVKFSKL